MSNIDAALRAPQNQPKPVTWWIMSYYASDADGTSATTAGTMFKSQAAAVAAGRAALISAGGVGVVYLWQTQGMTLYKPYDPVAN